MPSRRHPWLHRIAWMRRNRCSALLGGLCLLILANPLFGYTETGHKTLVLALLMLLLLATWALRVRKTAFRVVLAFAAATAVLVVMVPTDEHWLKPIANGTMGLFNGIVDGLASVGNMAVDGLTSMVDAAGSLVERLADGAINFVESKASGAVSWLESKANGAISWVELMIEMPRKA